MFAAAADKTERIRFGPNVTHVFLREPTLICQQIATLDELTNGRMELIVSTGNFGLLAQYGIDWESQKPLSRLREAIHVMRTFLADGAITFEGDFFKYNGLYTFARPVQDPIPIKMGAMKGPRSFRTAGEIAEGVHHALSYSREAYDYMAEKTREGAEKAGRNVEDLDLGAWTVTVVSDDSAAAKRAARILVAFYISSMPPEQLARHGIEAVELAPVVEALGAGDIPKAVELFKPEYSEKLSLAGHARGVRGEDQGRHRADRRQPHDPRARRPGDREAVLGRGGRERAGHARPAQARGRADDARVHRSTRVAPTW